MGGIIKELSYIAAAIVGLAIIAVLVSRNANTAGVLTAGGNAFANAINAAIGPVMGGASSRSWNGGPQ